MYKKLLFLLCMSLTAQGLAQEFTKEDAIKVVDTFFDGFHKGDTTIMRSVLLKEVALNTVYTAADGDKRLNQGSVDRLLIAIADRPEDQVWKEELLDYKVEIDGDLAQVWTPYRFSVNGNFSHCGANSFTLVNTNDGWKIQNLIDSRRKATCD